MIFSSASVKARSRRAVRLAPRFVQQVEQDLDGAQIGSGRSIDELSDDRFALGDLWRRAVLGDHDPLVQRLAEHASTGFSAARSAARIAGLALLETGVARRLAIAHLVVAFGS